MVRRSAISEAFLAQAWQQQLAGREPMLTMGGDTVEVLHPGRPTNDCGPDFRDALIAVNRGRPFQGDVELHVNARDWQAHGHHRDHNYDRVILHVALQSNGVLHSPLCNGKTVPVVTLAQRLPASVNGLSIELCQPPFGEQPCYQAFLQCGEGEVVRIVEDAGTRRFRRKAQRFSTALAHDEPDQVLYEGLMRALGYSHNKEPFERLARALPLRAVRETAGQGDLTHLQALLLGTAGLLPSQRPTTVGGERSPSRHRTEVEELERVWARTGHSPAMKASEWRFHGIRPENSPTRRIIAAGHLLVRFRGRLLEGVLRLLDRLPLADVQENLERSLRVQVVGYWASHSDFGTVSGCRPALIGLGRARDIIVNAVLPFCLAWGSVSPHEWLRDVSLGLCENHPEMEENWITRYMKDKLFGNAALRMNSARRQQGLIELHEAFCAEHRCHKCPLGGGYAPGHGQAAGTRDLLDAEGAE